MKYCIASGGVGRLSQLFVESHDFNFKKGGTGVIVRSKRPQLQEQYNNLEKQGYQVVDTLPDAIEYSFWLSPSTDEEYLKEVVRRSKHVLAISSGAATPFFPRDFNNIAEKEEIRRNIKSFPEYVQGKLLLHLTEGVSTLQCGFFIDPTATHGLHADTMKKLFDSEAILDEAFLKKAYRVTLIRDAVSHMHTFIIDPHLFPTNGMPVVLMTDIEFSRQRILNLIRSNEVSDVNITNTSVDKYIHLKRYTNEAEIQMELKRK